MKGISIIQQCLDGLNSSNKWAQLPETLKNHHGFKRHVEQGYLSIRFPRFMKIPLFILSLMSVLISKNKERVPTTVAISETSTRQEWARSILISERETTKFNSSWLYLNTNQFIEYVTPFIGLVMSCDVRDKVLHIDGVHYILDLKLIKIKLPENLLLGHTQIREWQISDDEYEMDFRLIHPCFGQVYQYTGRFQTVLYNQKLV